MILFHLVITGSYAHIILFYTTKTGFYMAQDPNAVCTKGLTLSFLSVTIYTTDFSTIEIYTKLKCIIHIHKS